VLFPPRPVFIELIYYSERSSQKHLDAAAAAPHTAQLNENEEKIGVQWRKMRREMRKREKDNFSCRCAT
jgi:hypothetical protein